MAEHPQATFHAGGTSFDASQASLRSSIDDMARAELLAHLEAAAPDWWAPIEIRFDEHVGFRGSVLSAYPEADGIRLAVASGIEMTEILMGIMSAEDFPPQDVIYASAKAAGFPRERMVIHGLDDLPLEPVEVVTPLQDVEVGCRVEIGQVTLLPATEGRKALDVFTDVPKEIVAEWANAQAFALVLRDARALADAELEALEVLDAVLAWLAVRTRFGQARLPDGSLLRFNREAGRAVPKRHGVITVRGLATNRRWLRDPEQVARREPLALARTDVLWPPLTMHLPTGDRLALLTARRAALSLDPVERAAAISAAFEYYSADAAPPPLFMKHELKRLRDELPEWLSDEQSRRLHEVLGMANQYSLAQRLRTALRHDGVPVNEAEWSVLQRVRKVRNRAAHGSEAPTIEADDLELASSILSRALVYRMARIARAEQGL